MRALVLALITLIYALDAATGPLLPMQALYLAPIAIAAWSLTRVEALAATAVATVAFCMIDIASLPGTAGDAVAAWHIASAAAIFFAFALTVSWQRDTLLALERRATHDPLTGLLNADRFQRALERERARAARGDRPLTVVVFDLEGLAEVTETHGDVEGERVLETIGATLQGTLRDADLAARIGRESFALAAPECDADEALSLVTRLRAALLASMWSRAWPVSFHFGSATTTAPAVTPVIQLVEEAQAARASAPGRSPASPADSQPPSGRARPSGSALANTR